MSRWSQICRNALSPRFEPCRTSEISLTSGLNIVHSFVPLFCTFQGHGTEKKKKGNNPTCIIYWDLPLQRGWHFFLFCLHCEIWRSAAWDHWMWRKNCSRTISFKNTLPVRFSEGRGADRSARTSCSGLVQQIVSSSGCVYIRPVSFCELWSLFFFLFCWMYSGRKQVQLYTSTERSVKIGYSQVNLASRWDLASASCSYDCWETKQPKWMKKVHLASAQLASSFILCCSFRSLSFATLHLRVIRRKLDLLDVWPLVQEASGVHMPPYIT